jgi:hypothetical protein
LEDTTSPALIGSINEQYICPNDTISPTLDLPAGDLLHLISQLCSAHLGSIYGTDATINLFLPAITQLSSLLSATTKQPDEFKLFSDVSTAEKDFEAICGILDQQNILHDGVSFKGIFEIDDPFSFIAGTKNNPVSYLALR